MFDKSKVNSRIAHFVGANFEDTNIELIFYFPDGTVTMGYVVPALPR